MTETATITPQRKLPLRSWELASYRAGAEHTGHGCPNDPHWPAAVHERSRAYATNLRAILASAAEQRNARLDRDWGTAYGPAGVTRHDRWERGGRPSAGFRLGFIDSSAREWPYEAQRAQSEPEPDKPWAPDRGSGEHQALAVLWRMQPIEARERPRGYEPCTTRNQALPDPRALNTLALAWHVIASMTVEERRQELYDLAEAELQDGHDPLQLLDSDDAEIDAAAREALVGGAVADAAEEELDRGLLAILTEKLPHDPVRVEDFVRAAADREAVAPLAWLAGHLGWAGAPASCTTSCPTCNNE